MAVSVELGRFNGFTLDDPVLGLLDQGALDGGIDFEDVSDRVFGVSVSRGRNRDLDRTNAGQVSVRFRNEDRGLDPANGGPLRTYVVPRLPVRVSADGTAVFTGLSDDWNFSYQLGGQSTAEVSGSDAFSLFARETSAGSAIQELSGARLERVLDDLVIAWPQLSRDIDGGNATLAAGVFDDNTLTYVQTVEESEAGLVFMSKDGTFTFRERLLQPVSTAVQFTDQGGGIRYENIQIDYGTELLANQVTVTSTEGTATAFDISSRLVYGVTERNVDSLLASASLQGLADFILFRYKKPEYRIANVTVNLLALSPSERLDVLDLELGDQADVIFTPNRTGSPIAIRNRVIGISHDVGIVEHSVTFAFEALPFDFFELDDAVYGKLDNTDGVLGF